jgi:hypothetical protein
MKAEGGMMKLTPLLNLPKDGAMREVALFHPSSFILHP